MFQWICLPTSSRAMRSVRTLEVVAQAAEGGEGEVDGRCCHDCLRSWPSLLHRESPWVLLMIHGKPYLRTETRKPPMDGFSEGQAAVNSTWTLCPSRLA